MTANTLEERKKYINEVRASFGNPEKSDKYRDLTSTSPGDTPAFSMGKIRLILAILIFLAFLYCDKNQIQIGRYSTKEIYKQIEESISIEKVLQMTKGVL